MNHTDQLFDQMMMDYEAQVMDRTEDPLAVLSNSADHRSLQNLGVCWTNPNNPRDAVWFEMDIMLTSYTQLECSTREWNGVRVLLEDTVKTADLDSENIKINRINAHICRNNPVGRMRRVLLDQDSGAIVDFIDDDDHRSNEEIQQEHRELGIPRLVAIIFHLFFHGGGKCMFCNPEILDRRRGLTASTTTQQQTSLRGAQGESGGPDIFFNSSSIPDETAEPVQKDFFDDNGYFQEERFFNETDAAETEQSRRRRLTCGGCFRTKFLKRKDGSRISGTPYLGQWEYWPTYGFRMRAFPKSGSGFAPKNNVRIYDTSFRPANSHQGDLDLGSPNKACPGGGPGVGNGGKPKINGKDNPGANCEAQGNVLIIQQSKKKWAQSNRKGGTLVFDFRYPVTLNSIGLMDADDGAGDHITVYSYPKRGNHKEKHFIKSYGDNSIETIQLNRKNVYRLDVFFPGSGAVRFLDFCHICGEEARERQTDIDGYYPAPQSRGYENKDSVAYFLSIVPELNDRLSRILEDALRDRYVNNRNERSHCLYRKDPKAVVAIQVATPVSANNCRF